MFGFIKRLFGPPPNFKELVANGAIIVDVRTPEEYHHGHIPQSVNIPLNKLKPEIEGLMKKKKVIITVCRSGSRSAMGKSMLKAAGIETYNGGPWNSLEMKLKKLS